MLASITLSALRSMDMDLLVAVAVYPADSVDCSNNIVSLPAARIIGAQDAQRAITGS